MLPIRIATFKRRGKIIYRAYLYFRVRPYKLFERYGHNLIWFFWNFVLINVLNRRGRIRRGHGTLGVRRSPVSPLRSRSLCFGYRRRWRPYRFNGRRKRAQRPASRRRNAVSACSGRVRSTSAVDRAGRHGKAEKVHGARGANVAAHLRSTFD